MGGDLCAAPCVFLKSWPVCRRWRFSARRPWIGNVERMAGYPATARASEAFLTGIKQPCPGCGYQVDAVNLPARMVAPALSAAVQVDGLPIAGSPRDRLEYRLAKSAADLPAFTVDLELLMPADEPDSVGKRPLELFGLEVDRSPVVAARTVDPQPESEVEGLAKGSDRQPHRSEARHGLAVGLFGWPRLLAWRLAPAKVAGVLVQRLQADGCKSMARRLRPRVMLQAFLCWVFKHDVAATAAHRATERR